MLSWTSRKCEIVLQQKIQTTMQNMIQVQSQGHNMTWLSLAQFESVRPQSACVSVLVQYHLKGTGLFWFWIFRYTSFTAPLLWLTVPASSSCHFLFAGPTSPFFSSWWQLLAAPYKPELYWSPEGGWGPLCPPWHCQRGLWWPPRASGDFHWRFGSRFCFAQVVHAHQQCAPPPIARVATCGACTRAWCGPCRASAGRGLLTSSLQQKSDRVR